MQRESHLKIIQQSALSGSNLMRAIADEAGAEIYRDSTSSKRMDPEYIKALMDRAGKTVSDALYELALYEQELAYDETDAELSEVDKAQMFQGKDG